MARRIKWFGLAALVCSFGWAACEGNSSPATSTSGSGTGGGLPGGGLGVGALCIEDGECRAGLACTDGTCQPAHSLAEGDPCIISAECMDGLYCVAGACAPGGEGMEGDACTSDADCASGFRCDLQGFKAVCVPEGNVDLGGSCESSSDCFAGLACVDGSCDIPQPGMPPFGLPWAGVECPEEAESPVQAYFHVPRSGDTGIDYFQLPFPNDVRKEGSTISYGDFPTPGADFVGFDPVRRYIDAVEAEADGWGAYPAILFRFSAQLDIDTFGEDVHFVDLTDSQTQGLRWFYSIGGGKYICPNRIAISPSIGRALEPGHTYAAYFTTGIKDPNGDDVLRPDDLVALLGASPPADAAVAAHYAKYAPFRQYLSDNMIDPNTVLNASVFTVGNPRAVIEQAQGVIDATAPATASQWTLCDSGVTSPCPDSDGPRACGAADPNFHELHALVDLPIFQEGTAPYLDPADGGALKLSGGAPVVDHTESVCLSLTIPKSMMPPGGWPTVVFAHGTGGHFRSHIDSDVAGDLASGVDDGQGNTVVAAVLGIDQVQHGPRRNGSTESPNDLFFNVANPAAARGNPQQGAIDQMSLLRFVPAVTFVQASSPTGQAFSLAPEVAFWGHSQGATEGALATPYGDWAGVVFSGQGASLKDALVTKTSPVNIAQLVPLVLQDWDSNFELPGGSRHPVLIPIQQHIDGGDPVAYARLLAFEPPAPLSARHVFQPYGQDDTFTPAGVQRTYLYGARLELVGADASVSVPEDFPGKVATATPASGNLDINGTTVSAFTRQYAPSNGDDGHFVAFDVPGARADVLRFLAGSLSGVVPQVGQ
jgi:hypothetical protein